MVLFIKCGLVVPSLKVYFLGYIYGLCNLLTTCLRLAYDFIIKPYAFLAKSITNIICELPEKLTLDDFQV